MEISLRELADRIGATLTLNDGDPEGKVRGINAIKAADATEVTFVKSGRHIPDARRSAALAVVAQKEIDNMTKPLLLVPDTDAAVIAILTLFAPALKVPAPGVHPSAVLGEDVEIGEGTHIGPHVSLADGVRIGAHTVVGAGCRIGQGSVVGDYCLLDANVVVYHHCTIGNHVLVQANTTIGALGFGYATIEGQHRLVPHNGGVIIEDFVDIGANCCIDRAKFTNTIVGAGTKLDNLVQIGHNVVLGKCCLLAAQTGVAGSTTLGDGVVLAGQSGVADNLIVADGTMVGAKAGVMKSSTTPGQKLLWMPALEQKEALRILGELYRLPKTIKRLKLLAERFEKLDASDDD